MEQLIYFFTTLNGAMVVFCIVSLHRIEKKIDRLNNEVNDRKEVDGEKI